MTKKKTAAIVSVLVAIAGVVMAVGPALIVMLPEGSAAYAIGLGIVAAAGWVLRQSWITAKEEAAKVE